MDIVVEDIFYFGELNNKLKKKLPDCDELWKNPIG